MTIITIGISILIREAALLIWDEKVRSFSLFHRQRSLLSISLFGAHISPQVLWVLGASALIMVLLTLFSNIRSTGRSMRACAANPVAAGPLRHPGEKPGDAGFHAFRR